MNTDRLLELADLIERTARFNLSYFAIELTDRDTDVPAPQLVANCDTVGCVAGWTNALIGNPVADDTMTAAEALGMDMWSATKRLFYAERESVWAEVAAEFGWATDRSGGLDDYSVITAPQAATVLRRIAHGEIRL